MRLMPVLRQPALVESVVKSLQTAFETAEIVLQALLIGASEALIQQPMFGGGLLVALGIIFLWGGVFRQLSLVRASN
jgi:hypothetical protein